jgi:3'-5' exoribonuclease 1
MKSNLVVVDLEATCWPPADPHGREDMEIIEIGALLVETPSLEAVDEFDSFVRPLRHPTLSGFCKELTSIDQEDIDQAAPFPVVLEAFLAWTVNPGDVTFASWGRYDLNQLRQDCALHRVNFPFDAEHLNVKVHFAKKMNCRACGISAALKKVGLRFEGKHHRGIDDARMVVKLLQYVGL